MHALKTMVNLKQNHDESLTDYLKRSKAASEVLFSHAGKRFCFPKLVQQDKSYNRIKAAIDNAKTDDTRASYGKDLKDLEHRINDEFLGFLFMENLDRSKYGTLLSGLETQHSLGHDQYPKTLVDAHTVFTLC